MPSMYDKIKKQNGETFAQALRNYHNGLLEIPNIDVILRHAGREAEGLLPYLTGLLAPKDDQPPPVIQDPFVLLDQAGYEAFYADTLEKQNSIKKHFQRGELLCTFNDAARYKNYHIVHALKKDVHQIRREDFKGQEAREDAYGTSVISIQMLKSGGFISIKNRYNHTVAGCDNTFNSNPDNIIEGLTAAMKSRFMVEFSTTKNSLPEGFTLINDTVFKYHTELHNFYYGDQAWAKDGVIHTVDRGAGDALFGEFLFDHKTRTLKKIDPDTNDSFADDFNRCYGGNPGLCVQNGNLTLKGEVLIGAVHSRIETIHLPLLTTMSDYCLANANTLREFSAPVLTTMGNDCFFSASALIQFNALVLTKMGNYCLCHARALREFNAPALTEMGEYGCLHNARALTEFKTGVLETVPEHLKHFNNPAKRAVRLVRQMLKGP